MEIKYIQIFKAEKYEKKIQIFVNDNARFCY